MWYIPFAIGKLHQASAHVMILSWPKDGRKHLKNCRPLHLCSYSSFVSLSRWILSLVLSSGLLCPLFQLQSSWWHDCRSVHLIERSFPFCSCVHFRLTISVTFLRSSSLTKTPACFSNVNTHSCDVVSCTYIRLILELWQRSHNFRAFGCCFCCNRTSEHATGKCDVADSAQLQAMDGGQQPRWHPCGAASDGTQRGPVVRWVQAARWESGPNASDGDWRPLSGGWRTGWDHRLLSAAEKCHGKSTRNCSSFKVSCCSSRFVSIGQFGMVVMSFITSFVTQCS